MYFLLTLLYTLNIVIATTSQTWIVCEVIWFVGNWVDLLKSQSIIMKVFYTDIIDGILFLQNSSSNTNQ